METSDQSSEVGFCTRANKDRGIGSESGVSVFEPSNT